MVILKALYNTLFLFKSMLEIILIIVIFFSIAFWPALLPKPYSLFGILWIAFVLFVIPQFALEYNKLKKKDNTNGNT